MKKLFLIVAIFCSSLSLYGEAEHLFEGKSFADVSEYSETFRDAAKFVGTKITIGSTGKTYDVISLLSSGCSSDVFLVQDSELRQFALKRIDSYEVIEKIYGKEVAPRIEESYLFEAKLEFSMGQRLEHPNIVKIYDFFICSDENGDMRPYLLMEYVHGQTLDLVGTLTSPQSYENILEFISALQYALTKGFIHHELTSDNVMIDHEGHLKLLDLANFEDLNRSGIDKKTPGYLVETIGGVRFVERKIDMLPQTNKEYINGKVIPIIGHLLASGNYPPDEVLFISTILRIFIDRSDRKMANQPLGSASIPYLEQTLTTYYDFFKKTQGFRN